MSNRITFLAVVADYAKTQEDILGEIRVNTSWTSDKDYLEFRIGIVQTKELAQFQTTTIKLLSCVLAMIQVITP